MQKKMTKVIEEARKFTARKADEKTKQDASRLPHPGRQILDSSNSSPSDNDSSVFSDSTSLSSCSSSSSSSEDFSIFSDATTESSESSPLDADLSSRDGKLIQAYLNYKPPLHVRRTLDQFYYLGMDSTKGRDKDQVVAKPPLFERLKLKLDNSQKSRDWGTKAGKNSRKIRGNNNLHDNGGSSDPYIIMVDQLWLWIIDDGIFFTTNYLYDQY